MIVKKSVINAISKAYLLKIKECYNDNKFTERKDNIIITSHSVFNKDIIFKLAIKQTNNDDVFKIGAFYYHRPVRGKFKIKITLFVNPDFEEFYFEEVLFRIKAYLIHEIEHHLQRNKAPFREKLPLSDYEDYEEYISAPSELESYIKQIYYLGKYSKRGFYRELLEESFNISEDEEIRTKFIMNIIKYLSKRKDLNYV